jgi:hypothetical protein
MVRLCANNFIWLAHRQALFAHPSLPRWRFAEVDDEWVPNFTTLARAVPPAMSGKTPLADLRWLDEPASGGDRLPELPSPYPVPTLLDRRSILSLVDDDRSSFAASSIRG